MTDQPTNTSTNENQQTIRQRALTTVPGEIRFMHIRNPILSWGDDKHLCGISNLGGYTIAYSLTPEGTSPERVVANIIVSPVFSDANFNKKLGIETTRQLLEDQDNRRLTLSYARKDGQTDAEVILETFMHVKNFSKPKVIVLYHNHLVLANEAHWKNTPSWEDRRSVLITKPSKSLTKPKRDIGEVMNISHIQE